MPKVTDEVHASRCRVAKLRFNLVVAISATAADHPNLTREEVVAALAAEVGTYAGMLLPWIED